MFKNKLSYTLLLLHLFMLNGSLFPYSSFAADQPVQVCVSPNSIQDQDRETRLVYKINRLNSDTTRFVNEINNLELEMKMYGKQIDLISETARSMATPLVPYSAGWLKIFPSIAKKPLITDVGNALIENYFPVPRTDMKVGDIPGLEIDMGKEGTQVSLSKALLQLTHVFEAVTPSRIADWITGTSLAIAEAREVAIESQAQAALTLSKYLREVRQRCEQVNKKEQERIGKILSNTPSNTQGVETVIESLKSSEEEANEIVQKILQEAAAAAAESKKDHAPPPENINFRSVVSLQFTGNDKAKLLEIRNKRFNNLIGIPACSALMGPTFEDSSTLPVWGLLIFSLGFPSQITQAFNVYLTEVKVSHEDSLQTQYLAKVNIEDTTIKGTFGITWVKDRNIRESGDTPTHLKWMWNNSVMIYPYTDKSTVQCNF